MSSPRRFLQEIAREAMRDRGFEPDFSTAAEQQVARLQGARAAEPSAAISALFPGARSTTTIRVTSINSPLRRRAPPAR